jgi:virulence factor
MIRVGLVDFDTSHVEAFTQRFNHLDVAESEWVDGAKVVAGCPVGSRIVPERILISIGGRMSGRSGPYSSEGV